jgi:hypothetical protein
LSRRSKAVEEFSVFAHSLFPELKNPKQIKKPAEVTT